MKEHYEGKYKKEMSEAMLDTLNIVGVGLTRGVRRGLINIILQRNT